MKIIIDTETQCLTVEPMDSSPSETAQTLPLYSKEAFEIVSEQWLTMGWDQKYAYTFTWLGLPVTQLPEDLMRLQEVIFRLQPDVILETGISRGGSLIFYASLCRLLGKGRVMGIDKNLWKTSQTAIETHPLKSYITIIEGDSADSVVINQVKSLIQAHESTLVILDSNHSKAHMLKEMEAYHTLVKPGSYLIATDGIMKQAALAKTPRANPEWIWDNAEAATQQFCETHPEFSVEQPPWPFNKSPLKNNLSQWPNGWLLRKNDIETSVIRR